MCNHPKQDLPLQQLAFLLNKIGDLGSTDTPSLNDGKRQIYCQALAIQRTIPLWKEECPESPYPMQLLLEVERFLNDDYDAFRAGIVSHRSRVAIQAAPPTAGFVIEVFEAAQLLLSRTGFISEQKKSVKYKLPPPELSNAQIYPGDWPSVYMAAVAFANGAVWHPESSNERRRLFWSRWLLEDIPESFHRFPVAPRREPDEGGMR
jgi:hypothetical protein